MSGMNRNRSNTPHLITFLVTCIVLLLPISAFAFPTWVYVDPAMPQGSPPQIEITYHCDDYTKVKVEIPGFWCEDVYSAGETFQKIWVPVYGTKMEEGKPELPVVRGLLGIPGANKATDVEVLSATWEQFSDYLVYPHQPDYPLTEPPPPFEWDEEFYQQNLWYPGDEALLSNPWMFREIKVVNNHIQCFQYNPAREFLKVASEMEIKVSYGASEGGSGGLQLEGETINGVHKDFEPLYQSLVWNYRDLNCFPTPVTCDYLIITGNNYENALTPLVTLLQTRGYTVNVVTMDEVPEGTTPLAVYHYIQDRHEAVRIAYVLLVGGVRDGSQYGWAEGYDPDTMVPFPYWLPGAYYIPEAHTPSDVCYACLCLEASDPDPPVNSPPGSQLWEAWWESHDWYPDVYVGRLTADTVKQVEDQVDKIIYYENKLDPRPDPSHLWYDHMVWVNDDGPPYGYFNDTFCHDQYGVLAETYDIDLPNHVLFDGAFGVTNDMVMEAIEQGCFILNYHGHGTWAYWGQESGDSPGWTITPDSYHEHFIRFWSNPHITDLENEHLPVVYNIGCNLAMIDIEWDDTHCDYWLRIPNYVGPDPYHGGVATIGATRLGMTGTDRKLVKAFYQTMYGVAGDEITLLRPVNIIGAVHYGSIIRAAGILNDPSSGPSEYYLKFMYNHILLGEPSMEIRNIFTETGGLKIEKPNLLSSKIPLEVTIYPNPSPGIFILKVQGYSPGLGYVKVYDLSGRLIRKIEFPQLDTVMGGFETGLPEMEMPLDLTNLSEGLYLLNVGDEVTERVLILK